MRALLRLGRRFAVMIAIALCTGTLCTAAAALSLRRLPSRAVGRPAVHMKGKFGYRRFDVSMWCARTDRTRAAKMLRAAVGMKGGGKFGYLRFDVSMWCVRTAPVEHTCPMCRY